VSLTRFRRLAGGLPAAVEVLQLKQEVGQHQEEQKQQQVRQQHQEEEEEEEEQEQEQEEQEEQAELRSKVSHTPKRSNSVAALNEARAVRVCFVLPCSHQAAGMFLLKQEVVRQHQEEEEETESGPWQGRVAAAGSNEAPAVANE
jgi:hypothetical protein